MVYVIRRLHSERVVSVIGILRQRSPFQLKFGARMSACDRPALHSSSISMGLATAQCCCGTLFNEKLCSYFPKIPEPFVLCRKSKAVIIATQQRRPPVRNWKWSGMLVSNAKCLELSYGKSKSRLAVAGKSSRNGDCSRETSWCRMVFQQCA